MVKVAHSYEHVMQHIALQNLLKEFEAMTKEIKEMPLKSAAIKPSSIQLENGKMQYTYHLNKQMVNTLTEECIESDSENAVSDDSDSDSFLDDLFDSDEEEPYESH